ncbi:MarR family winged helix-turn-helix transcriptional regulator [Flavihumibacter petaseus]|nr:MarR family transcriptional regulator [Flavihumibacter petaseus]
MKCSESRYSRCMYFASGALARKIEKLAMETWRKVSLSPSHGYLLMMVLDQPGIQPGSVAGQLQLSPSTVTRLVEKLEEKKLVTRTTDGKVTRIHPTAEGKALYPELELCISQFHEKLDGLVDRTSADHLIRQINQVTDKLPY